MMVHNMRAGELVRIGEATFMVLGVGQKRVRLGIAAPREIPITKGEFGRRAGREDRPCGPGTAGGAGADPRA